MTRGDVVIVLAMAIAGLIAGWSLLTLAMVI